MAGRRRGPRGPFVDVKVSIDATRGTQEFKDARRNINQQVKKGLKAAGEQTALPAAKRLAPALTGRLRNSLVVHTSTYQAVLTTNLRGKKGRYVGLMEYGGTVRTRILPNKAKALTVNGQLVASVNGPRHYKEKAFLRGAVNKNQGGIRQAIENEVMGLFDGFK